MMNGNHESPIRVFLLIENRLLREAFGRLCRKRLDLQIMGQANSAGIVLEELLKIEVDVVAFDFFHTGWLSALCSREGSPCEHPKALLIGMEEDTKQFLDAVRAGISGYLLKDASASDMIAAIRSTSKGEAVCPPKLCAALFQQIAQLPSQELPVADAARSDLTLRQRQLVGLVAKGLTNKEIAKHLNLSEFTVRNHIHRILKMIDVRSRREAVDFISRNQVIEPVLP